MAIPDTDPAIFSNANGSDDEDAAPKNGTEQDDEPGAPGKEPPTTAAKRKKLPTLSKKRKLVEVDHDDRSRKITDTPPDRGGFQNPHKRSKNTRSRRRWAKRKEDKRCAAFQLTKQDGSATRTWTGEEELAQLYSRLEAARTETEALVSRFRETVSTWGRFVKRMQVIDASQEHGGSGSGPQYQSESIGDVAGGIIAPLKEFLRSWVAHGRELETFQVRVKEAICDRAFERRLEVPHELQRRTAEISRTREALDVLESLFGTLVCTLNSLTLSTLDGEDESRNDGGVGETEFALKQIKLTIEDLA
ncbi:hypothetical protein PG993_005513 [Apiospora rasikravindrae]|uniref:Uncharacterized protein n=1 Tax=Apiospora rasikravindrae TaxID=990691 RepID=A0ABR1TFT2_9PEZI